MPDILSAAVLGLGIAAAAVAAFAAVAWLADRRADRAFPAFLQSLRNDGRRPDDGPGG